MQAYVQAYPTEHLTDIQRTVLHHLVDIGLAYQRKVGLAAARVLSVCEFCWCCRSVVGLVQVCVVRTALGFVCQLGGLLNVSLFTYYTVPLHLQPV